MRLCEFFHQYLIMVVAGWKIGLGVFIVKQSTKAPTFLYFFHYPSQEIVFLISEQIISLKLSQIKACETWWDAPVKQVLFSREIPVSLNTGNNFWPGCLAGIQTSVERKSYCWSTEKDKSPHHWFTSGVSIDFFLSFFMRIFGSMHDISVISHQHSIACQYPSRTLKKVLPCFYGGPRFVRKMRNYYKLKYRHLNPFHTATTQGC